MGFELYIARTLRSVEKGKATIDTTGNTRFHPNDLADVGINGREAAVLVDAATSRIALRAPRESDGLKEPTLIINRGKSGTKASVNLRGPLRAMGHAEPAKVKGEYDVMHKDDLVIIQVAGQARRKGRKTTG